MALTIATGGAGEDNSATYRIDYAGMKVWYCAMTKSGKQIAPPEQANDITIECKERNSMHPEEVPEER